MKFVVGSLSEVAEALRGEYEERNGKFYLKTEGEFEALTAANTKLAEFRDNNRALNTKVTEQADALKKFEGIDVAEYTTLKTKVTELEGAGIKDKSSVADLVKAAVKAAVEPLQTENQLRKENEQRALAEAAQNNLRNQLREVGVKAGVDERALPDYISRGEKVFKVVDGKTVARNGDAPIFSKTKITEEISMDEWATELQADAPFLFKPSRGGGATGSGSGGSGREGVVVKKVIEADPLEFGRNLEGIAKGEVIVSQ